MATLTSFASPFSHLMVNFIVIADIAARKRTENELKLRQRAIEASANAIIKVAVTNKFFII